MKGYSKSSHEIAIKNPGLIGRFFKTVIHLQLISSMIFEGFPWLYPKLKDCIFMMC